MNSSSPTAASAYFRTYVSILFIVALLWDGGLLLSHNTSSIWNNLFNGIYALLYLFGGITAFQAVRRQGTGNTLGKTMLFFGIAMIAQCIGQFVWLYYNVLAQSETPFPSLADAFFMLFYPIVFLGFGYLLRLFLQFFTRRMLMQVLFVLFISTLMSLTFLTRYYVTDTALLPRIINYYYLVGDAFLIALAIIEFLFSKGKIRTTTFLFTLGFLFQAGGDMLFSYRNSTGTYWNGDISDLLFTISAFLLCLGILQLIHKATPPSSETS